MNRIALPLLAAALLWLAGCGGASVAPNSDAGTRDGSFTLSVDPATFENGGGAGEFTVTTATVDGQVVATVSVDKARDLKAFYFELEYDASRYQPAGGSATNLLAPTEQLLSLTVTQERGVVASGQSVIGDAAGFTGSGPLARVYFTPGPARAAAAAPTTNASRGTVSWDPATRTLSWRYYNQGDYNQDGLVSINDLSPLAKYFRQGGPFPPNSVQSVVDGDGNGQITISDLTPIAGNWQGQAQGYKIYKSTNPDDAPQVNDAPSTIEPAAEITFAQAQGNKASERLFFSYTLPQADRGDYFWVRPYDGSGAEGTAYAMAGGDDSLTLRLLNEPPTGEGTEAAPFVLAPGQQYQFEVMHSEVGDVSTDPSTTYTLDPATAGTLTNEDALLTLAEGFTGSFTVSATYFDLQAEPQFIYCMVEEEVIENLPPSITSFTVEPEIGDAPLVAQYTAVTEDDGFGGIEVNYEWDWNSDGTYDEVSGTGHTAFHTWDHPGTYETTVRVTDAGGLSDTEVVTVIVHDPTMANEPPVAVIEADRRNGEPPLTVNFDGSWSYDLDGDIVQFDWDLDGDGTWEIIDGAVTVSHSYAAEGVYDAWIRVTDDFGDTDETSIQIRAQVSNWDVNVITQTSFYGGWPQLTEVNGNAAMTYYYEADSWEGPWEIQFRRFDGTSWSAPSVASAPTHVMASLTDAGVVDGNPVAVYQGGADEWGLFYVRATDALGTGWGAPHKLDDGAHNGYGQLQVVDGHPAVLYYNEDIDFNSSTRFIRASDPQGNTWGSPVAIAALDSLYDLRPTLDIIDGKPATVYFNEDLQSIELLQALDAQGSSWGVPRMILADVWATPGLFAGGGTELPTLFWQGGPNLELNFATATDMQGTDFNAPQALDTMVEQYADDYGPRMAWVDRGDGVKVPAIAYFKTGEVEGDLVNSHVMYIEATNSEGTEWNAPEQVYTGGFGFLQIDIIAVDGQPHLAFHDSMSYEVVHATPK
jgi:hypothetical protein